MKPSYEELEARCAALTAENAGLNNFIASSCYVLAGEEAAWHPAIDHAPETTATNQLSIAESQFLTDVMTAAGLLSCGKRDTQLAKRLADFCVSKRGGSNPAQLRKGGATEERQSFLSDEDCQAFVKAFTKGAAQ